MELNCKGDREMEEMGAENEKDRWRRENKFLLILSYLILIFLK